MREHSGPPLWAERVLEWALPEGVWQIRYDLRAEVPGQFHALPVVGQAMYVPEIRCNGAEMRITVLDGAMKAGAMNFLEKPCRDQQLWEAIQEALKWDKTHRQSLALRAKSLHRLQRLTAPLRAEAYELPVHRRQYDGTAPAIAGLFALNHW